jgi:hypothetical protein
VLLLADDPAPSSQYNAIGCVRRIDTHDAPP